jgi:hypothetical protein
MPKRYNTRLIKASRSYSPSEIAKLFDIDRKTCFRWIKSKGLRVIEKNTNPLLVYGKDLKEFIIKEKSERKTKLKENEFYCMKCHKAVRAKTGSENIIKTGKMIGKNNEDQFKKIGLCEFCETKLNKLLSVYQKD